MSKKFDPANAFGDDVGLFVNTFLSDGFHPVEEEKINFKDLMATPQAAQWMPQVVETIMREPVEPTLVIPSLLDRVEFSAAARFTFPAIGAMAAADVAEGMAYPEEFLNIAPGSMTITTGKSGILLKITEEMQKHSQYDIINMWLRAGVRALNRHKEWKGMQWILGMGVTLFDNKAPTSSVFGTCTGRNVVGSGNGACRMEDLLKAYCHVVMQGFIPDTILLHPLAWSLWLTDPLLQSIAKMTGSGPWFNRPNPARQSLPWANASQNKMGRTSGFGQFTPKNVGSETPTPVASTDPTMTSTASIPNYFPWPLRVVVTAFAPFNPVNETCDIMVLDSSNLGALIVEEDISSDRWDDMDHDIIKVKLKEKYAFAIYEEGLGIGVIKNVPLVPNEIAFPVQPTISAGSSFSALDVTTAVL